MSHRAVKTKRLMDLNPWADLPQVKVVLSTLDPLGMPVATQVVSGDKADDPLYIPAIDQVREGVGRCGLLYVGDCKLVALETRTHLQVGADYYLGPFSLTQIPQETMYPAGEVVVEPSHSISVFAPIR